MTHNATKTKYTHNPCTFTDKHWFTTVNKTHCEMNNTIYKSLSQ